MNEEFNNQQENIDFDPNEVPENQEVKKASKKTVIFVVLAFLLLIFILINALRGCSVSKNIENQQNPEIVNENNPVETVGIESEKSAENVVVTEQGNNVENSEKESSQEATKVDEEVQQESQQTTEIKSESSKGLIEVSEPKLGKSYSVSVLISSKNVYVLDEESYAYSLRLVIPVDSQEGYKTVNYFCSKTVYDSVSAGESINASYAIDNQGIISILSVSK